MKVFASCSLVALCALLVGAHAKTASAEETYFRHDSGVAIASQQPLPEQLESEQLVWKQSLPPGHSTPCVAGDRVFVTAHEGNELCTIALDRATGRLLWRQGGRVQQIEEGHTPAS